MALVTPLLVLGVDVFEEVVQVVFPKHVEKLLQLEGVGPVGVELDKNAGEETA